MKSHPIKKLEHFENNLHPLAYISPLLSPSSSPPPDIITVLIFIAFFFKTGFTTNVCKLKLLVLLRTKQTQYYTMCGFLKLTVFIPYYSARFIHVVTYIVFHCVTECIYPFSWWWAFKLFPYVWWAEKDSYEDSWICARVFLEVGLLGHRVGKCSPYEAEANDSLEQLYH